jgi:hypothetical protein
LGWESGMYVCTRQITFHTPALELDSMLSSIGHHRSYHKIQLGLSAVFPKLPSSRELHAQDEIPRPSPLRRDSRAYVAQAPSSRGINHALRPSSAAWPHPLTPRLL